MGEGEWDGLLDWLRRRAAGLEAHAAHSQIGGDPGNARECEHHSYHCGLPAEEPGSRPGGRRTGTGCSPNLIGLLAVCEACLPAAAATLRGAVEDIPKRPDEVDVARMLARVGGSVGELAAPEVMDPSVAANEHGRDR